MAATVCFPFVGDDVGGSHVSALGLIKALDRTRFDPRVLVQRANGNVARLFQDAGIAVEVAPPTPEMGHGEGVDPLGLIKLAKVAPSLARFLRARAINIVHTNDGRTHATWGLPARVAGARLVWHHRGSPDAFGRRFLAPLIANQLIAVSEFSARPRRLALRPYRKAVIHSPFDTKVTEDRDAARAALLAELGGDPATRIVGFAGALIARKRPLLFVETIARLTRRTPGYPVVGVMFGEPFDVSIDMLMERARLLGVADAIRPLGFRSPGSRWLAACDVLMVPAIDEPFGRTLIEAMLVGTPVVATRSGGNVEALRDGANGLLVVPEDAGALAEGIDRILTDHPLRRAIVERAQTDSRTRFGLARHASEVMGLYDELLGMSPSPSKKRTPATLETAARQAVAD